MCASFHSYTAFQSAQQMVFPLPLLLTPRSSRTQYKLKAYVKALPVPSIYLTQKNWKINQKGTFACKLYTYIEKLFPLLSKIQICESKLKKGSRVVYRCCELLTCLNNKNIHSHVHGFKINLTKILSCMKKSCLVLLHHLISFLYTFFLLFCTFIS